MVTNLNENLTTSSNIMMNTLTTTTFMDTSKLDFVFNMGLLCILFFYILLYIFNDRSFKDISWWHNGITLLITVAFLVLSLIYNQRFNLLTLNSILFALSIIGIWVIQFIGYDSPLLFHIILGVIAVILLTLCFLTSLFSVVHLDLLTSTMMIGLLALIYLIFNIWYCIVDKNKWGEKTNIIEIVWLSILIILGILFMSSWWNSNNPIIRSNLVVFLVSCLIIIGFSVTSYIYKHYMWGMDEFKKKNIWIQIVYIFLAIVAFGSNITNIVLSSIVFTDIDTIIINADKIISHSS